ncbi:hypothetical protein PVAND_017244 [Polypedilum vanderplanki]|uniref:Nose resistant-to-fluoxetine protein N-terminal domain-containing protein n=1 Tax=Polypedilum vanderplanki TaxID=319348 RepID=A0A9J6BHP6_POLVA|nr:hypothetical protein PVAND_017244 [Polypedilum vanderplanki]
MSSLCQIQLNFFNKSILRREFWAMKMLDMSSKISFGILHGNTRQFGLFTECLDFKHTTENEKIGIIYGQYCTVNQISFSNKSMVQKDFEQKNLQFESGICVPSSCNLEEVKNFANSFLKRADLTVTDVFCQQNKTISLVTLDYFIIFILSLLLLTVIGSTIYEMLLRKQPYKPKKVFISFSLYSNMKELFTIDNEKSRKIIACMNGLRSLAAFWVVAGHRTFRSKLMMSRPLNLSNNFVMTVITFLMTVEYAVDLFLLLSAILATQSCLRAFEKGNLNLVKIYVNRYLRYSPSVLFLLLFILSFIPYTLVNGPSIRFLDKNVDKCQTYWLSTILMVQNYANVNNFCLGHTWYLNADFQLYLISPIFIFLLYKFRYKAFYAFLLIIIAIQSSVFYIRYNDIITKHVVYRQTHYRIGQWLVGIAFGYFMYQIDKNTENFKLNKKIKFTCWFFTGTALIVTEVYYRIFQTHSLAKAFYEATNHIFFTIFFGWSILAFHHLKSGSFVRWFLSHPLWQPTAKLSLSIYLVHDVYIRMTLANLKELSYFDVSWLMHIIAGDILISILFSIGLYLFVEAPIAKLLIFYLK